MALSPENEKTNKKKPRLMSGTRATGVLHVGHYFGALKNWLELQDQYECYLGVMDWHGLTTAYKQSDKVNSWIENVYAELLAWGIDLEKSVLFVQSQVPEHLELFMVLANLTPMGWLERVPTWKDAEEEAKQSDTHNLGRFAYPVLQAADIAIYKGLFVPVGQDQVAHLELTREIIRRFNKIYKLKFPEPKALLSQTPLLPGLDGRKMSKSYGNSIELTEESGSLRKKLMGMPTDPNRVRRNDPGDPEKCPVWSYHKIFTTQEDHRWVQEGCRSAGIGCGDCKMRLFETMDKWMSPAREKKKDLLANTSLLHNYMKKGQEKARAEAQKNLNEIRIAMGLKA